MPMANCLPSASTSITRRRQTALDVAWFGARSPGIQREASGAFRTTSGALRNFGDILQPLPPRLPRHLAAANQPSCPGLLNSQTCKATQSRK